MTQTKHQGQTGPKSKAGKNNSKFNALKTGLFAKSTVLPFEDEKAYRQHVRMIEKSLQPENALQQSIVQQIADSMWRGKRQELRATLCREEAFKNLTPVKMAGLLGITGPRQLRAPAYLIDPKNKFKNINLKELRVCLEQYEHLSKHVKGIQNYQMVWRQYSELFIFLHEWLGKRVSPPLFMSDFRGLNLEWQQSPKKVEQVLEEVADHLWYVIHFEDLKPQIQHWLAVWYFIESRESQQTQHLDELILRERRYGQGLLDSYLKLRKSTIEYDHWIKQTLKLDEPKVMTSEQVTAVEAVLLAKRNDE
jgi:hypothetical protein